MCREQTNHCKLSCSSIVSHHDHNFFDDDDDVMIGWPCVCAEVANQSNSAYQFGYVGSAEVLVVEQHAFSDPLALRALRALQALRAARFF